MRRPHPIPPLKGREIKESQNSSINIVINHNLRYQILPLGR